MKPSLRFAPLLIAAATLAYSQEEFNTAVPEPAAALTTPIAPHILGAIPDGTPPPPSPPKPEFPISRKDVLATAVHEQGGRTITIREIKPIALPPPPAEVVVAKADEEFSQRLSEYREANPRNELLFLGATVFRPKDSPPRTLVRWWPQGSKETITFWSSADFALIAGGINSFADSAGNNHQLMMGWGNVDIERITQLYAANGRDYDTPDLPDLTEGKATFQIEGEHQPSPDEIVVIQSLHDIYNNELERLRTAYEGRERARLEREEYLKANPPQPKDITINYWRTEKPVSGQKGGPAR